MIILDNMSSEDEFDLDFVSNASKTVKKKWKKIDSEELKDVTNTAADQIEVPKKKKKAGFMDSNEDITINLTKSCGEGDSDDDEVKTKPKESSQVSLTPPGSPAAKAQVKVRGAKATKKTEKALSRLQGGNQRLGMWGRQAVRAGADLEEEDCLLISTSQPQTFQLKIVWKSKVERIEVAGSDRIEKLTEDFSKKVGAERGEISLYREELAVDPLPRDQTLAELGLSHVTVVHARTRIVTPEEAEKEFLEVKLRTIDKRASEILVKLKPTDTMETLMNNYSQQAGIKRANLKFSFDGDQLESGATAEDLELEDGDIFDVEVLS